MKNQALKTMNKIAERNLINSLKSISMKLIFTLISFLFCTSLSQAQTELLVNPNFTSENYGWTVSQDFKYNTQYSHYNFDPGYAYLPQIDKAYGILDQVVSIPSNTTSCTFSFYYKITSDEITTTTAFDKCMVQMMDNSGNRYVFVTLSNLDESGSYQYASFSIPSSFFGKQVTIRFIGDNDGAKPTIFRIDNCSVKATQSSVSKPDLTVKNSFSSPSSITTEGTTVLFDASFKNQGSGNVSGYTVKYFLSETSAYNQSAAVLLATQSYNALSAGSSSSASIYLTIPAGLSPGTKYILSYVDPSNAINESNENNNIGAAPITLTSAVVNKPDLTVTSSFSSPSSVTSDGSTILLNVNFKNQGSGNAGGYTVKYYLSETNNYNSNTAVLLATQSYGALSAGGSSAASLYLTIPAGLNAGTKYILSYVDPSNAINESNENNNIGAAPITITKAVVYKPDLTISSSNCTPNKVIAGGNTTVYCNIKNLGNANSNSSQILYYLSDDETLSMGSDIYLGTINIASIWSESSGQYNYTATIPSNVSLGNKYVILYVDGGWNYNDESNENNNIGATPITISAPVVNKPDLTVTGSFSTPSTITTDGNTILFNANFKNLGTGNANSFNVKYFLSETSAYNPSTAVLLATQTYSALSAGSSSAASLYLTIPGGLSAGTKYILSYVDSSNVIDESNENNNMGAAPLTVNNPAPTKSELLITSFTTPDKSTPSGAISVSCTIENIGGTAANGFIVSFHLSDDASVNAGDLYLSEYFISSLGVKQNMSFILQLNIPLNATTGHKLIIATIDGTNVINEQIENNNSNISYIEIKNKFIQPLEFNPIKSHLYWPFYNSQDSFSDNPFSQWSGQFNGSAHPWRYTNNHDLDNNGEDDHHVGESYYAQDWNYLTGNSDCGMNFYAPMNGTIIKLSNEYTPSNNCVNDRRYSSAGNYFIILSTNGQYAFKACHFNELSSSLYVGREIQAGDYLGKLGNTGISNGTHVHCVLYKNLNSSLVSKLRNYGKIGSSDTDYTYACDFDFDAILDGIGGDDDELSTSNSNNSTLKFTLYPNPSDEVVNIQLESVINFARVRVIDLSGKIFYESIEKNINQFSIKTSDLENGIYFINIVSEVGEYSTMLFVRHYY